jgi:peptidylprolyl isomerase
MKSRNTTIYFLTSAVLCMSLVFSCSGSRSDLEDGLYAEMKTDRGVILIKLEYEKTPLTVASFIGLAEGTIHFENGKTERFFDGLSFYRVVEDFVIQSGDPTGEGVGGPGYRFPDEFHPTLKHDRAGVLSMANSGPNTNGSQFFITITDRDLSYLDGMHTVFGHVVEGLDVARSIRQDDTIKKVRILRIGPAAGAFRVDQVVFDQLLEKAEQDIKLRSSLKNKEDIEMVNKEWPDAIKTETGLRYVILKRGTGKETPKTGDQVTVHYTGKLLDGTVFDSSVDRNEPAQFKIGEVIAGWNEALVEMKKGEKRTLIIPPELGYGERGYPGLIPPNAYLIFDVELLEF